MEDIQTTNMNILQGPLIDIDTNLDNSTIKINEIFTYYIKITNRGSIEFENIELAQRLPNEININKVSVNQNNIIKSKNDIFELGELKIGESLLVSIEAKIIEKTIGNTFLNNIKVIGKYEIVSGGTATIEITKHTKSNILNPMILMKESSSLYDVVKGDVITFKIDLINVGNIQVKDIVISNLLNPCLRFMNNSVIINGKSMENENILSGIKIGILKENEKQQICFEAEVVKEDGGGEKRIRSSGEYKYILNEENREKQDKIESNGCEINIERLDLYFYNYCNKKVVYLNDDIEHIINIENKGTLDVCNAILNVEISKGLELIEGSFKVDGQIVNNVDINKGISLGDIETEKSIEIKYMTKYVSSISTYKIKNKANLSYNYRFKDKSIVRSDEKCSICEINSTISTFKQLNIDENLYITTNKPEIHDINDLICKIEILENKYMKTIKGKSNEGQFLTGHKVLVKGFINYMLEYSSCKEDNLVYSSEFKIPFSDSIILPSDFQKGSKVIVEPKLEDLYFKKIDSRTVFQNATILLIGKIMK